MNKHNQQGFSPVLFILIVLALAIAAFAAWTMLNKSLAKNTNNVKTAAAVPKSASSIANSSSQQSNTTPKYDPAKVAQITHFDTASDSLKSSLISAYFDQAKKDCDTENASVSADARLTSVMTVQKIIRDEFAQVEFCGSGGSSILAHIGTDWKKIGSLAMSPACSLVDQYKISKEITANCYVDGSSDVQAVTYP